HPLRSEALLATSAAQRPMLPVTWPRGGWRLPWALGPSVSNDLLSVRGQAPVTRCSLRLSTTGGRLRGGNPISPTACCAGPAFSRVASTSPQTEACQRRTPVLPPFGAPPPRVSPRSRGSARAQ